MSLIYGATGTLEITAVAERLYMGAANKTVLTLGLVFLVAGLAFKLGVVPFHMWIRTSITAPRRRSLVHRLGTETGCLRHRHAHAGVA